ncbi:thiamine pyrophosphate-dependent enzyme [Roseicyclus persicicus]|uniref:Thiamine pyrophosphate-binding protein n=1 Tax=Roseicyclus persicicus TaxID=2650661 RepID=A0A7X6GVI8_9RHOB|nr:thiamine pyrophosphate-dependent enzyme [Roseibacterium persicicum]NKX43083.1 thiamine pyrophosphate-binding protein [Roseibacterium persicicum]
MSKRHGGKILADQLAINGVRRVFSVPGESFLAALDGLYDHAIQNVVCRQEGGAAMMAEAHAKLTGEPGVLFVTRGPGATNASSGLHVAMQDQTPMVVFVGQIALTDRDRGAFQEVDYRRFFSPLVKWAAEVETTARLPEYIARAFHVARSGRPGPVVLALPEDVLSAEADVPDLGPAQVPQQPVDAGAAHALLDRLLSHDRPLVVAGGPGWSAEAQADLQALAEATGLPVAVTFRRQDYMDNGHPNYIGDLGVGMNPRLGARLRAADALLILGARLGETATNGYTLVDPAAPGKTILHVHPDPDEIGAVYQPTASLAAPAPAVLAALRGANGRIRDAAWTQAARADYEAWQVPQETPGDVKMEQVVRLISDRYAGRAIYTNGAGNYAAFLHRYGRYHGYRTQLAPTSGSMGYGLPAAVAAKLEHPDRPVICFAGDGCLQMTIQELSTARQHGADITVIIANNGRYGTIRMHQENHYPGRVSGTELFNPDYVQLAAAYGGTGHLVTGMDQLAPALDAADRGGLHLIELRLDARMLSTTKSL